MNKITTFQQFQDSKDFQEDISDVTGTYEEQAGYIYLGSFYIVKTLEQDPVTPEINNIHYEVYIGNGGFCFGDDLAAAERYLWDNFAAGECNWKNVCFDTEFGTDYQLDQKQVLKLLELGFDDTSWHNNICPTFDMDIIPEGHEREPSAFVSIWFDAPDPENRETGPDAPQFAVNLRHECELIKDIIETDDFDIALAHALAEVAIPTNDDDWGSDRQIAAQNKFFEILEGFVTKDNFEKIEDYAMKATVEEMLSFGLHILMEEKS